MKVFTRKDVDKVYSEVVAEYLAKGQLNSMSMGSSNGDIAHVDVAVGNDVYRIRMVDENIQTGEGRWDRDHATLVKVLKYKNAARKDEHLWDKDGEEVETRGTYFSIDGGSSRARAYVEKEGLAEYWEIHKARVHRRCEDVNRDRREVEVTKELAKIALRAAAKTDERGFKSFKSPGDVKKIEKYHYEMTDYIWVPSKNPDEWRQQRVDGTRVRSGYNITFQIAGKNQKILNVGTDVFVPNKK